MERSKQRMVLFVVTTAGFLSTFMISAVNIALPQIGREWDASDIALSWIPLGYMLAGAALLMPVGRLADTYGRKRLFTIGMAAFSVTVLAAALSRSASVLITFRLLQGCATASLFSSTTAMTTLAYPLEQRGRALGMQVGGVYLGLTLGPVLGGVITDELGWRYIFILVGAVSVINTVLTLTRLQGVEWREPKRAAFDVRGSVIWAVALSLLLVGFSLLPRDAGWALIAAGAAGIAAFVFAETRSGDPVLNVALLRRNRVFAFSNAATFINYAATAAMTFLMSLYLQYNKQLTAEGAALVLVTGTVVQTIFSPVSGRLADRVPARYVASAGMAVCIGGLAAFIFLGPDSSYAYIIAVLCSLGLGFAFFATPIIHAIMGSIERHQAGVASATIATMRMTGQSISQGLATLVLALVVGAHAIMPADYPHFLTSVRITFAIFTGLCVLGAAASYVGPAPRKIGDAAADAGPPT
jgi:EmrB/QacA subfamily drug resistance transporter